MEIITVKNVDEVLKVALTKSFKRVEWVEVDQISKKPKDKEELSTHQSNQSLSLSKFLPIYSGKLFNFTLFKTLPPFHLS